MKLFRRVPKDHVRPWVQGKALKTVIYLSEVAPGDEVYCLSCSSPHTIREVGRHYVWLEIGTRTERMAMKEITAWRRP